MKKLVIMVLFVLWAVMFASCAPSNSISTTSEMINPGDKIGDFLITTGEEDDVIAQWQLGDSGNCVKLEGVETYSCTLHTDTKVNVTMGVFAGFSGKDLDTVWSESAYELYINDRPVDLEEFGFIDVPNPRIGTMRYWNVVIVANQPGEITVFSKGVEDGDDFEDTTTFIFNAP